MPGVEDVTKHGIDDGQKRVYIAGPYTGGQWGENIQNAVIAGQTVYEVGHIPFIPHTMTGLWSALYPNNRWITFDLKWVEVCDALIRLPGESEGADSEVRFARHNDIPVHFGVDQFLLSEGETDQETVLDADL